MADGTRSDIPETLGIEPGMTVVVLNEPNWFHSDLGDLPEGVSVYGDAEERPADLFIIFAASPDEAERGVQRALTVLPEDGLVWVLWERDPPETIYGRLDEQVLRELFSDTGLVADESRVINDTWQGLSFVVAEENRGGWEEKRSVS